MAWLNDVAEYLEDQSAVTVGTNCFVGYMPDTPATCVAVYDAGGDYSPHGYSVPWEEHQIEIRVRAASYSAAETLMTTILGHLNHKQALTFNGSLAVQWVKPIAPPALLERDEKRRYVFLGRFVLQSQRSEVFSA